MVDTGSLNKYKLINKVNDKYILCWNLKKIGNNIYNWNYEILNNKPTIKEVKNIIESFYNNIIKNNIQNKFKWNGMNITLTIENQIDYKLLFDTTILLNGTNLPEKIKFKINNESIYYSFETLDDFKDFIICMNNHIRNELSNGYKIKESIDYEEYKHYLETL